MNFELSEEQDMLRDSLASFLSDRHSFAVRRAIVQSDAGYLPEIWRSFATELGILGAPFAESIGGSGGSAIENMIVMEELGKALSLEPWLECIVIGGSLLLGGGNRYEETLRTIIAGDVTVIPAVSYFPAHIGDQHISTNAVYTGDGAVLSGEVSLVRNAGRATHFIVSANRQDAGGPSLFLLPADAAGLSIRNYAMVDGSRWSDLSLNGVVVPADSLIAEGADASARLANAFDAGVAALCAEALGIQRRLLGWTVDYARQRKQFGRPIWDFQVLQHRMAEMFIRVEESTSMTYMLTARLSDAPERRAKFASAAKVLVDQCARVVGESAVQIHGGMGMTRELPIADYFSRLVAISHQLGSTEFHFRRYEAASFPV